MMKLKKAEMEEQGKNARLQADPQGELHMAMYDKLGPLMEALHKTMSSPAVIERDHNGRAISLRRVLPN